MIEHPSSSLLFTLFIFFCNPPTLKVWGKNKFFKYTEIIRLSVVDQLCSPSSKKVNRQSSYLIQLYFYIDLKYNWEHGQYGRCIISVYQPS